MYKLIQNIVSFLAEQFILLKNIRKKRLLSPYIDKLISFKVSSTKYNVILLSISKRSIIINDIRNQRIKKLSIDNINYNSIKGFSEKDTCRWFLLHI